jgi:hypothetical protein
MSSSRVGVVVVVGFGRECRLPAQRAQRLDQLRLALAAGGGRTVGQQAEGGAAARPQGDELSE